MRIATTTLLAVSYQVNEQLSIEIARSLKKGGSCEALPARGAGRDGQQPRASAR
jgi:hypothetical protein